MPNNTITRRTSLFDSFKEKVRSKHSSEVSKCINNVQIINEPSILNTGDLPIIFSKTMLKQKMDLNFLTPEFEEGLIRNRAKSVSSKSVEFDDKYIDSILSSKERRDSWQMAKMEKKSFLPSLSVICKYNKKYNTSIMTSVV